MMKHQLEKQLEVKKMFLNYLKLSPPISAQIYDDVKEEIKDLSNTIECQLTKRELEIAICYLEAIEMEFKHSYMKDTLKRIIEKLRKQKEMWVSDDE